MYKMNQYFAGLKPLQLNIPTEELSVYFFTQY